MLKKISSWFLFFLLLIEGSYLKVLLSRTGYGNHGTSLGCDTLFIMYAICLITLVMAVVVFFKTRPISYLYSFYLIISLVMLITFISMNATGLIIGIGDGIEESWGHYFCPKT
jgi:bacteriorhodopsin